MANFDDIAGASAPERQKTRENLGFSNKNGLKTEEEHLPVKIEIPPQGEQGEFPFSYRTWDEMNIVETPFCVIDKRHAKKKSLALSPTGDRYLVNGKGNRLPGPLAEPIVLGLLWMTMERTGFSQRGEEHRFAVRELVEDYMYPERFRRYRADGRLIREVEEELKILGETILFHPKWFDKDEGRRVEVRAPIFGSLKTWDEGGNSRKMAKLVWGPHLESSVLSKYTTGIDGKIWRQIEHPLDRRLFRWLNRQLAQMPDKGSQPVKSCQNFARFKMTMQGSVIERGGRTASSYIIRKLTASLRRLQGMGFAVRMMVDRSRPDFSIQFVKITGTRNEVVDEDPAAALVFEFKKAFHGAKKKSPRVKEGDLSAASEWIEAYGFDKAAWMVWRCKEHHGRGSHSDRRIHSFKGLEFYEASASADYDRKKQEKAGQLRLRLIEIRKTKHEKYQGALVAAVKRQLSPEEAEELRQEAEQIARKENPYVFRPGMAGQDVTIKIQMKAMMLERANAMSEDEFTGYRTDEELDQALLKRHGWNPTEPQESKSSYT